MDVVGERYLKLYGSKPDFRAPKQYIHVQRKYWAAVFIADNVAINVSVWIIDINCCKLKKVLIALLF